MTFWVPACAGMTGGGSGNVGNPAPQEPNLFLQCVNGPNQEPGIFFIGQWCPHHAAHLSGEFAHIACEGVYIYLCF